MLTFSSLWLVYMRCTHTSCSLQTRGTCCTGVMAYLKCHWTEIRFEKDLVPTFFKHFFPTLFHPVAMWNGTTGADGVIWHRGRCSAAKGLSLQADRSEERDGGQAERTDKVLQCCPGVRDQRNQWPSVSKPYPVQYYGKFSFIIL